MSESNESHLVALATKMAHRESGIRRRTIRRWGFPHHLAFTGLLLLLPRATGVVLAVLVVLVALVALVAAGVCCHCL